MNKELGIKAVVFDIDGTLSKFNSWHELAIRTGGSAEEDLEIYFAHKNGEITSEEACKKILEMWKRGGTLDQSRYKKILESIPLREDVLEVVNYLKSKDIRVCLITGAMKLYAEVVAAKLGLEDFYGNAILAWDKDGNIDNFTYEVNQAALKLVQFKEFCKKYNLKPEECVAVGDSENDHLLFVETKKGIAIRTELEDKELEQVAWKVVDELSEIKQFL